MPRIPLIEDLTTGPIPPGNSILVEYDPASLWYNVANTIAAGWLRAGGRVVYAVAAQPLDKVRSKLKQLGIKVDEIENKRTSEFDKTNKLMIFDIYTATLGQKSREIHAWNSLKVADLSVEFLKDSTDGTLREIATDLLRLWDNASVLARFNEERSWIEFELARRFPRQTSQGARLILPVIGGVHSAWAYRQLESVVDGIVDFKLEDVTDRAGEEARTIMRIRSMRDVGFDGRWHVLKVGENFEVTLER